MGSSPGGTSLDLRWLPIVLRSHALRTKAQVIYARSKENITVFQYFIRVSTKH